MLNHIPSPSEESEYYGIPLQQVKININICKVTSGSSFQYKYWFGQNLFCSYCLNVVLSLKYQIHKYEKGRKVDPAVS